MKKAVPHKSTESGYIDSIVLMHQKDEVVNERLSLADRAYMYNSDKEFVVKFFELRNGSYIFAVQ